MTQLSVDDLADRFVRAAAAHLTTPFPGECLACFVARMLEDFGCDTTLRFARRFRDLTAPRATALERRLAARGGYCDCEIYDNAVQLHPLFLQPVFFTGDDGEVAYIGDEAPDQLPGCAGVRRGNTEECRNWLPRRRPR